MKDYSLAVFIGRFQPFHVEHLKVVRHGLSIADNILVLIGSARTAPTVKNPFTFKERVGMISRNFSEQEVGHIFYDGVSDYFYNDTLWLAEVQQKVAKYAKPGDNIALLGMYKDGSSYYLDELDNRWEKEFLPVGKILNATDIRNQMFDMGMAKVSDSYSSHYIKKGELPTEVDTTFFRDLSPGTLEWLKENYFGTENYHSRLVEFQANKKYKEQWKDAPYPPIFVTVDAVVIQSGHVLLVKRRFYPGKGLYALPGGFVKPTEKLEDAVFRELKEETGIAIRRADRKAHIKDSKVFDYPGRSLRGRTITHAYHINPGGGHLATPKSGSDAESAFWMPIAEVYRNEENFFEDHFYILQHFLLRGA